MRAPFDKTCDFLTGPTTANPYIRYIVGAPCRRVDNPLFRPLEPPRNASVEYATIELAQPAGPQVTDLGGDKWQYDYGKSDRLTFSDQPTVLWKVTSVVACTGPDQPTYWRAEVVPTTEIPLTPCQRIYRSYYRVQFGSGLPEEIAYRQGPTTWITGTGKILAAEFSGQPGLACNSTWVFAGGGFYQGTWNGQASTTFPSVTPGAPPIFLQPGPP